MADKQGLKQKIEKMKLTCYAANGDEIEMLDPKDVKNAMDEATKHILDLEKQAFDKFKGDPNKHDRYWAGKIDAFSEVLAVLDGEQ